MRQFINIVENATAYDPSVDSPTTASQMLIYDLFHDGEMYGDGSGMNIEPIDGHTVYLYKIWAEEQGKGRGSRLLKTLCSKADEYNVTIELEVAPDHDSDMEAEALHDWYSRNGFELDYSKSSQQGANIMVREPSLVENQTDIAFSVTEEQADKILKSPYLKRGVKIGKNARLWRGESEESGSGMAVYGSGIYFTVNRTEAKQYGEVRELGREYLPTNPIRFDRYWDWQMWLQTTGIDILGYENMRDFSNAYHDVRNLVQTIDPTIDGIQMFTGKDAMFVLYTE